MTSATAADPAGLSVLFLTHAFPRWSGDAAGSFILRLARALGDQRIRVGVLAPHAAGLPSREQIDGIDVVRFRYAPVSFETLAYTGTMAEQVRASWPARAALVSMLGAGFGRALREQRRLRPSVLHAHWWFPSGVLGAAMKRLSTLPLITTMHGSDVRLARSTRAARSAFRWVLSSSSAATSVSRWLSEQAHAIAPSLEPPLVAPMPAATELFSPGPGRERDRLLYVGRLNTQKGIELLLRAVAEMRHSAVLDVVGDGPDGESLRALASSLGIANRVNWHGALPQERLAPFYRRAAGLVVPSRDEGLGLVAVEAQLCETPVVAFDSGGLPDIIEHDVSGILVKEFASAALARDIDELLDKPERALALGRAGRHAALRTFAPEAVARTYATIYRDVAAARSAAASATTTSRQRP
jgi:glycosyltransferase involved in cell wall biosynthesis